MRSNAGHSDFINLVKMLDRDLSIRDGKDHAFYSQFNKIDNIQYVVVIYFHDVPVGCGAMKQFKPNVMEIKRMFVLPEQRNRGFATLILNELEKWATELSYSFCLLETGKKQPEAIALYKKNGYMPVPNYGQYIGIENSLCFEKQLKPEWKTKD